MPKRYYIRNLEINNRRIFALGLLWMVLLFIPPVSHGQMPTLDEPEKETATSIAPAPLKVGEPYVDQLIDPNVSEDSFEDLYVTPDESSLNLYQIVETSASFYKNNAMDRANVDAGISYSAYKPTANYGNLRLNLEAGYEDNTENSALGVGTEDDERQYGLRTYSLEQIDLPLTESLALDTTIGTHRSTQHQRHLRYSRRIQARFGADRSEILGVTSSLRAPYRRLVGSYGEVKSTSGNTLSDFWETEGRLGQLQFDTVLKKKYALGVEVWHTDDFGDDSSNGHGLRVNWDVPVFATWGLGGTAADSDGNSAFLTSIENSSEDRRQELGGYYFDPEFYWKGARIGDDSRGGYYLFSNSYAGWNYGGSIEYRQDGAKDKSDQKRRDTLYLSSNSTYRLTRRSSISGGYSYRWIDDLERDRDDGSSDTHSLRGGYSLQHNLNIHSLLGVNYLQRMYASENADEHTTRLYYSLTREFHSGSQGGLSLEYELEEDDDSRSDGYSIDVDWQKDFANGSAVSLGVGYSISQAKNEAGDYSDQNWSAHLSHQWPITERLNLSSQLSYNRINLDDETIYDDGLFTDDELDDERNFTEGVSIDFRLTYHFGNSDRPAVLAKYPGRNGSGVLRGRVFIDHNGDGRHQAGETGIAGVEIFLDSVYPTRTDNNGEFRFGSVGIGKHYLFVDESSLPLPWTLNGIEYFPLETKLRRTTAINIPLTKIP